MTSVIVIALVMIIDIEPFYINRPMFSLSVMVMVMINGENEGEKTVMAVGMLFRRNSLSSNRMREKGAR